MDWGLGRYQRIAGELLPAAAELVDVVGPRPGDRVLDVGCGTGSVALLAAARGAVVVGVDPTPALLELAVADAALRGVEATFVAGEAAALPVADASFDVVLSSFGVIFAADAPAAARELGRVTAPSGRIGLTAWQPGGVFARAARLRRRAIAAAGGPAGPPPAAWHDGEWVAARLGPYGFTIEVEERELAFTGSSPAEFAAAELADHPIWAATRRLVDEPAWVAVRDQAIDLFTQANEDPAAFRVTSRYALVTARRA